MLHENLNAAHHLTSNLIRMNHWKILTWKNPQHWQGYLFLCPNGGTQMKLMKRKLGHWQWWSSNIYQKFLSQSSTWQLCIIEWLTSTEMFEIADSRLCAGEFSKQKTSEKWIDAAELEWAKEHGGILYNDKWYFLDCQDTYMGNL